MGERWHKVRVSATTKSSVSVTNTAYQLAKIKISARYLREGTALLVVHLFAGFRHKHDSHGDKTRTYRAEKMLHLMHCFQAKVPASDNDGKMHALLLANTNNKRQCLVRAYRTVYQQVFSGVTNAAIVPFFSANFKK